MGMWAVPPDIDTEVLVVFAKGDRTANTAFWIGCVQKPLVNQQIPAHGCFTTNTEYNLPPTENDDRPKWPERQRIKLHMARRVPASR